MGHSPAIIPGFLLTRSSFIRDASGLICLYARYYDPQLGQFIGFATRGPKENADWQDRRIGGKAAAIRLSCQSALSCRLHGHDETGLYYLHADRLGSTMAVTNGSGNTVDDHGYSAYGRDRRGSELRTDRRFTGQQSDASGLIYMNARYYDPQLGQFISPDTLVPDATNLMDFNRYMYARGNPMKYNDPSGHVSSAIHDSDGGTIPEWLKQLGDHWADLYANDPTKLGPEIRLYLEALKGGFTEFQSTGKLLEIYYGQTNGGIIAEYQNTFTNAWSGGDLQTAWHLTGGWGANADAALLAGSVVAAVGSGHESVAPANDPLFKPGLHANPEGSIPASGPRVTRKERALIQDLGNQHGCHSCGATEPGGTGVWIGDHQPPTSIANGEPQRLYPQCQACSNRQGGLLSWLSR